MIERVFKLAQATERTVEKIIQDDNLDYIHMTFCQNEGLPIHNANSNVYMTVLQGTLSIGLDDQPVHVYEAGSLLQIPFKTRMDVKNLHAEILELIVVKAPAPRNFRSG